MIGIQMKRISGILISVQNPQTVKQDQQCRKISLIFVEKSKKPMLKSRESKEIPASVKQFNKHIPGNLLSLSPDITKLYAFGNT